MNTRHAIGETIKVMQSRMTQARELNRATLHSPSLGLGHVCEMWMKIEADPNMSEDKLSRWLGWIQASICSWGILTLDEAKNINRRHSEERMAELGFKPGIPMEPKEPYTLGHETSDDEPQMLKPGVPYR